MFRKAMSLLWKAENASPYDKLTRKQLIQRLQELEGTAEVAKPEKVPTPKATPRAFDFSKHSSRFVALRFSYLGWNYNGLNFQYEPTPLPTVEEEILQALKKAKLVPEADPAACNFSRCGRTDKGVSALNQVISLDVRSALSLEEQQQPLNDARELPYISILNALLPGDIRISGVCLRPPPKFDARFSCSYRHYKYLFKKLDLDLELMSEAAAKFEGVHDFRNFCKVDGSKQITNHCREVHSAKIVPLHNDYYVFDLKGSAFLWHQVRCMVAVLFLVGQKLEAPALVSDLVNIDKYPSKPVYEMANDIPLVLYDCVFPEMEWLNSANDFNGNQQLKLDKEYARFRGMLLDYELKANIAGMMEDVFMKHPVHHPGKGGAINIGDGTGRKFNKYQPVSERKLLETVATSNARYLEKKKRKLEESENA